MAFSRRHRLTGRLLFLLISLITLYVVGPKLLSVLSSWPKLLSLNPLWFVVMVLLEAASFVCAWELLRIALRERSWFAVGTAQLAGNAVSRIVPGGAAAGGATQFRMLIRSGSDGATVGSGVTAASLISTATLLALPLLSLPAMLLGRSVPSGLTHAAWLGAIVFAVAFGIGWVLLTTDGLLTWVGHTIEWAQRRFRPSAERGADIAMRLLAERDMIARDLGEKWWQALGSALGNWLFDYLALLAALTAVGSRPRPSLVLLAYVASMVLGMIPLTPGGLGFVEAGLTALLIVAGVSAGDAALATLAYRLISYWLPLPAGLVATVLHRRRYEQLT